MQQPGYQQPDQFAAPGTAAFPGGAYGQPSAPPYPGSGGPAYPASGAPGYPGFGAPGYPSAAPPAPPKKSRALLVTLIVVGLLVLCGGGGAGAYLLTQNNKEAGKGLATPALAADGFLTAVYKTQDAASAEKLVCADSLKKAKIEAKINEIRDQTKKYNAPRYNWSSPTVSKSDKSEATLTVTIKLVTADEQTAEQKLKIITTKGDGWFVCEVSQGS
jgi:hypothetical protein